MCERPFDSADEMNETLIYNFNTCVKKNDTVYIFGDIAHRIPVSDANHFYPVSIEHIREFFEM